VWRVRHRCVGYSGANPAGVYLAFFRLSFPPPHPSRSSLGPHSSPRWVVPNDCLRTPIMQCIHHVVDLMSPTCNVRQGTASPVKERWLRVDYLAIFFFWKREIHCLRACPRPPPPLMMMCPRSIDLCFARCQFTNSDATDVKCAPPLYVHRELSAVPFPVTFVLTSRGARCVCVGRQTPSMSCGRAKSECTCTCTHIFTLTVQLI
jgi:hypothetical protein